jgi:hypothetical protein
LVFIVLPLASDAFRRSLTIFPRPPTRRHQGVSSSSKYHMVRLAVPERYFALPSPA